METNSVVKNLKECYYELAGSELAMNYYSFCESEVDPEQENDYKNAVVKYAEFQNRFKKILEVCINKSAEGKAEALEEAKKLREELKDKVNALILFGDKNMIDEYVEARKGGDAEQVDYKNDDDYARELLTAIFESNDNSIINENILSMVYELPIRMTKNRFFDILDDGFKKYIGSPADVLDKFVFLLESAAGLNESENVDYNDDEVSNEIDYLTTLTENVNYAFALLENADGIEESLAEKVEGFKKLIDNSNNIASKAGDTENIIIESVEMLERFEGVVENLIDKVNSLSGKFESLVNSNNGSFTEEKKLFDRLDRLMSNSVFAELEAADESAVDEATVKQKYDEICDKLKVLFEANDRARNRAVMAAVLKELPVFFNSRTDVMNYVRESLSSCRDIYEKSVAISRLMEKIRG